MNARRVAAYGLACLILGWVVAGWLEANHVSVLAGAGVLLILVLIVTATADRIARK